MIPVSKKNEVLKESISIYTLENGMKCYLIPKKDYISNECAVVVFYGANDISFKIDDEIYNSNLGTAHFIEHKLFAKLEGDVFSLFAKQNAEANAFTDFGKTVYYFTCNDNLKENLKTLIYMVKKPYFTNENVNSEKDIIKQEITMYEDNPDWCCYYNMLNIMYNNHPIKNKIAGNCESVEKIDEKMLYKCYNSFYVPSNMALVCAGNFNENDIFEFIKNEFSDFNNKNECSVIYKNEESNIIEKYIEAKMDIKESFFNIGYKLPKYFFESDIKKSFAIKILSDILFGESSNFYKKMYEKGILKEPLGMDFISGKEFAFLVITGQCLFAEDVAEYIIYEFEKAKKEGIMSAVFDRIKKKHCSRFIRGLNSIDAEVMAQIEFATKNTDIIDAYDSLMEIDIDYIKDIITKGFFSKDMVLSVVKPKE